MSHNQNNPEREVFLIYLQRTSPVIRLNEEGSGWRGRLHHLSSGQITPLDRVEDLLPAINRYIQIPPQPKKRGGLK